MGRGKSPKNKELIARAAEIIERCRPISVRGVAYKLFTMKLIPDMGKTSTDRVSIQLRDAREAGIIPWASIVDEGRTTIKVSAWDNPEAFAETVKRAYRRDRWQDQPCRITVFSEKSTVYGIIAPVLDEYGVGFVPLHGFNSTTKTYNLAVESRQDARPFVALYLGDWDPSGLFMSEVDLPRRLARYGGRLELTRIALTDADCASLGTALSFSVRDKGPRQTKNGWNKGDPRYPWFRKSYGERCWELDALDPNDLRARIESAIVPFIDLDPWQRHDIAERAELDSLTSILSTWPTISRQAQKYATDRPEDTP